MSDYITIWREFQPHEYLGMTDAEGDMAQEIERLRSRLAELEKVRSAAQSTIECWDMLFGKTVCMPAIDEKFDALRTALKEDKP